MPNVNCFRRVLLDVGGKKTIISVPHGMTETEVNKVLVVTRAYLQQYVYVEMVLAECFIQKIEKSILKKKCVRFEVKKKWVDCKKNLRKVVKYYDAYVPNADFNNEFAMTFYDKISGDLYKCKDIMAVRNIVRQWNEATEGYSYRFKGGDIFIRLVKVEGSYELRNPIGYDVQIIKCTDLDEADAKAKEVLEAFFEDKVNIKVI